MYRLRKNSFRVINDSIVKYDGTRLDRPSIMIYDDLLIGVGEYETLKNHMPFEGCIKGYLLDFNSHLSKDFTIQDACYIIRRCDELIESSFIEGLVEKWGSVDFLDWLNRKKSELPMQVER